MDKILYKMAYKKKGLFSGIYGIVQENKTGYSKYCLEFKDGTNIGFNKLSEIEFVVEDVK